MNVSNNQSDIPVHQVDQLQKIISKLFQCCQERIQYQCDKFGLHDAEIRCLMLFGEERYLTVKGIAPKLNVVKSRVTKIVNGLIRKDLVQKVRDPNDSRILLLSLTPKGQAKLEDINVFMLDMHAKLLSLIQPDQRNNLLANLETLKLSMEAVKEMME
jgi:DNA-binding MarR family transcriptional regulator